MKPLNVKFNTYSALTIILLSLMGDLQMKAQIEQMGRYATINGLKLYYEVHGNGRPLVLLHGGGSTIQSTFGRILLNLPRRIR
jgi:hypothetical protein